MIDKKLIKAMQRQQALEKAKKEYNEKKRREGIENFRKITGQKV